MGQTERNTTSAKRIVFLDYLRVFAFLSVLIGHNFYQHVASFALDESIHSTPRFIMQILLPLFYSGGAGVVVFFLVSGYIITFVLQTERPIEFIIKRGFRIYPLYITVVLLLVALKFLYTAEFPDLLILIPQLLLIGDLFGTPYTLAGVEWTLRLEVLFYAFMVFLRYFDMFYMYKKWLPPILVITCLALCFLAPIPSFDVWSKGYVTMYGPFLLLGSFFYLNEVRQVGTWLLAGTTMLVLMQYYYLVCTYNPESMKSHFATLGFLVFFFSWKYRSLFASTPFILLLSDLTYSVYLLHKCMWIPIKTVLKRFAIEVFHPDVQSLIVLFLLAYLSNRFVEKPGIRLGKSIVSRVNKSN